MQDVKNHSKRNGIFLCSAVIAIVALLGMNAFLLNQSVQVKQHSNLVLNGVLTLTVDNKTVVKQDTITTFSFDYISCLIWDAGCTYVGSGLFPATTTIITTATLTGPLIATFLTALALSTSSQTSSTCTNAINANGLSPIVASTSHTQGSNTPVVTLLGSWTYTGSSITVSSVCLEIAQSGAFITQLTNTPLVPSGSTASYAYEDFSGQTLSSGQSIGLSWTFNM
jgi:hypothetical protein